MTINIHQLNQHISFIFNDVWQHVLANVVNLECELYFQKRPVEYFRLYKQVT